MAKAMGMNSIALYIMWNTVEQPDGSISFAAPQYNVSRFIEICREEGMYVMVRPGPFVCAEWDFGGLPPRLLKDTAGHIRTTHN